MILGIGIDSVEIERFAHWHTYSQNQLRRIFSTNEIAHCLQVPHKSAERFAVRFAAREAFFKAMSQAWPEQSFSFLRMCRSIEIAHMQKGAPYFLVDQMSALSHVPKFKAHLSLTHTRQLATAFVILSKT